MSAINNQVSADFSQGKEENMHLFIKFRAMALMLLLVLPVSFPSFAQGATTKNSAKTYVFVLSSADMPVSGAALHLAISALKSGRNVEIALLADGVGLGRKGAIGSQFAAYKADGPAMLMQAMGAGAHVFVCQICLANQNIGIKDMVDGVAKINAFELLDLTDAADVVLSFGATNVSTQISISTPVTPEPAAATVPAVAADEEEACDPATDIDACM